MKNTDKQNYEMISRLADSFGPSGFEDEVLQTAALYTGFARTHTDSMRNMYIISPRENQNKPTVMLDAHSDEVGFMIHSTAPDGTLRFVPLGPPAKASLPSSEVLVRNTLGEYINGVISCVPPHYAKEAAGMSLDELRIDIGAASAEEAAAEYSVGMGEPAVFSTLCKINEETGTLIGKAFDCRIGCAALIETMHRLADEELGVNICGALSSQEEVGARGVKVSVNRISPDVAICFEGCPADDTIAPNHAKQTKLGFGPMLRYIDGSMITNPRFQRFALEVAEKYSIPVQTAVRSGSGTDGSAIHIASKGIPTIVIGIPVRYIHSPACIAKYRDFVCAAELAEAIVKELSSEIIKGF